METKEIIKEAKVINLQEWIKANSEKLRQKLLQQILERGNPLDKTIK